jgi:hypothetical protein
MVIGLDTSDGIGRDFTCMVIKDPVDGSVMATGRWHEFNTAKLAIFIVNFLIHHRKAVLVPERKSSAPVIIDSIILTLRSRGVNPYNRIFNYITQDREDEKFKDIDTNSLNDGSSMRKYLGYMTTAATRVQVYDRLLLRAVMLDSTKIKDSSLINELATLSQTKGRIDHTATTNDDMVFAYCLASWFIFEGKHVQLYGLDPATFLTQSGTTTQLVIKEHINEQLDLRVQINDLQKLANSTQSHALKSHYLAQVAQLKLRLDDTITADPAVQSQLPMILDKFNPSNTAGRAPLIQTLNNIFASNPRSYEGARRDVFIN